MVGIEQQDQVEAFLVEAMVAIEQQDQEEVIQYLVEEE